LGRTELGDVTLHVTGPVTQPARDYAIEKVAALARLCARPILNVRISLTASESGGASAAASLDVNGIPVRAHAEGTTSHEAIDFLQARLRTRLVRHEDRRRSRPRTRPEAHSGYAGGLDGGGDEHDAVVEQHAPRP
jgi:ribosome-associated translation inhibitor RaiA